MTDSDDKLSRRYRELASEEPSAHVDAAILAAARREVGAGPRARRSNWMVPTSIAAVLMLGVGVSLRMQMEEPGIETSAPASSAEYPAPPSVEPPPQAPSPEPAPPAARPAPESKTLARRDAPREERARAAAPDREVAKPLAKEAAPTPFAKEAAPKAFADAPSAMQQPFPAAPPAVVPSKPAPAQARVESATAAGAAAPSPQSAPEPRAKREAVAADNAAPRESRALGAIADPDPARELERIARLREAARHEEADRALAEFRRRHPDYRIPEAMWERVKPH